MATSILWPPIGGTAYSIPSTGETNWGALSNFLIALSSAQGTNATKFSTRVATTSPVTVTSASDTAVMIKMTLPGPVTVNLPPGVQGQFFNISDATGDAGTNNITVFPSPGDTINNGPSFVINSNNDAISLIYDATILNWKVTSQILSFTPGSVARSAIQSGTPNYVVYNAAVTGLLAEEQYLAAIRGGFGQDVSLFSGVLKRAGAVFSASPIVNADIDPLAAIDASKISTGIVDNTEFNRLDELGLLYSTTKNQGGVGSINGGNPAQFDLSAGVAKQINYSSPLTPTINTINFGPFVAQTVTNLATADLTYLSVNAAGALVQRTSLPTPSQQRDEVYLARINHFNRVSITFIDNIGNNSQSLGNQYADLLDALGPFNISGNTVSANGANLSFNKSSGFMFSRYFNQVAVPTNPHNIPILGTAPTTFQYRTQTNAGGGNVTVIDPTSYDVGGVVTAVPNPGTNATVQRVFLFPSGNIRVQYGQNLYASLALAVASIPTASFVAASTTLGFGILIGYIVVQKNCLDLSPGAATAVILPASRFDAGSGGGISATGTTQTAYNNSISPLLVLSASPGTWNIRDNAVPLGTDLWNIQNNAGTISYAAISTQGIKSNQFPTANRVMVTDANSAASQSAVTAAEVGFLAGTTGVTGTNNLVRSTSPVITTADLDGGTASNTARVTIPKNTYANLLLLTRKEGTILYATDLDLFLADDGISLSPVGGGASLNYNMILNPTNATNWSETGTTFATPVTTTTAGDLPLQGVASSAIQFVATGSGAEATEYNSYSVTTPAAFNGKLQISFFQRPGAGFVTGQWTLSVYQGATRQSLSSDSGGVTTLTAITGPYTVSMDALPSTAYTLRFARTTGAGGATLNVTNVFFGFPAITQGAAISDPQTVTVSGSWVSNATYTAKETRVGSKAHYSVRIALTGAPTAANLTINLPTGRTIDTTALNFSTISSANILQDSLITIRDEGTASYAGSVGYISTTAVAIYFLDDVGAAIGISNNVSSTAPFTFANTDYINIDFTVPIAEWAGNGTVNLGAGANVEYAYNSSTSISSDTTTFAYGPVGALIQNFAPSGTTSVEKRVRFQYPIQDGDAIEIQYQDGGVGPWLTLDNRLGAFTSNDAGTTFYGVQIVKVIGSTTDVTVNFYSQVPAKAAWSAVNTSRWRLQKANPSSPVGFGMASLGVSGLISQESTGVLSLSATGAVVGSFTCNWTKVSNTVTLVFPANVFSGGAASAQLTLSTLPSYLTPTTKKTFVIGVINGGSVINTPGAIEVRTDGTMVAGVSIALGVFTNTGNQGILATSLTYNLT